MNKLVRRGLKYGTEGMLLTNAEANGNFVK